MRTRDPLPYDRRPFSRSSTFGLALLSSVMHSHLTSRQYKMDGKEEAGMILQLLDIYEVLSPLGTLGLLSAFPHCGGVARILEQPAARWESEETAAYHEEVGPAHVDFVFLLVFFTGQSFVASCPHWWEMNHEGVGYNFLIPPAS